MPQRPSLETLVLSYDLGEQLDFKDLNQQIEDNIKRQITDHYSLLANVSRVQTRGFSFGKP